jgi:hypothetical protein
MGRNAMPETLEGRHFFAERVLQKSLAVRISLTKNNLITGFSANKVKPLTLRIGQKSADSGGSEAHRLFLNIQVKPIRFQWSFRLF